MSRAARSLFVFGLYLLALGTTLILRPNGILALFHLPRSHEVWIRVLGVLLLYIGTYYLVTSRREVRAIIRASIPVRLSLIAFLIAFWLLGYVGPVVIVFGAADAAGAVWTAAALRADRRGGPSTEPGV